MKNIEALNKSLALVLWAEDEAGEDDVTVFSGTLIKVEDNYYLERESNNKNPEIKEEWLQRINKVPEELKETLMGCEYQLSLSVGSSEEISEPLESFGLSWPK